MKCLMPMNENIAKEHQFCLRCGRRLKTDSARQIGFGPICLKKRDAEQTQHPLFNMWTVEYADNKV